MDLSFEPRMERLMRFVEWLLADDNETVDMS